MKKPFLTLSLLWLTLLLPSSSAQAACSFRMDVLDVGQGDATFIQTPECKTLLIDGGDVGSGQVIRAHLSTLGVSKLDLVVLSHYHQDHLAGLVELGKSPQIPVTQVIDRGGSYDSATYREYASLYGSVRKTATLGQVLSLGSVRLEVVSANGNGTTSSDENSYSVGVKVTYGELDAVIAGDLTGYATGGAADVEGRMASRVGPVEIYHVNHHGSAESSNDTLLSILQPDVALISVGWDNSYGHPTPEALERIERQGTLVYQTEDPLTEQVLGTISVFSSDGQRWSVSQGGSTLSFMARADGPKPVVAPSSIAVVRGTSPSGSVSSWSLDDGSLYSLSASAKSSVYATELSAKLSLGSVKPSSMRVVFNGRYSTSRQQTAYVKVPSSGQWLSLGTAAVGSAEGTVSYEVPSPCNVLASDGSMEVKLVGENRSSSYKLYGDALFVVWE